MKNLSLNELREAYLAFFASKEHLRLPSFSLVPKNDPSLLLIPAGMAPLKPYFTGAVEPPAKRITTCQKCIRTPDIERVGITARHGTFFEMLGNFSFGDYFKEDAIAWAWEFMTEVLEIPKDLLYPSVYVDDKEAEEIWVKNGVPRDRIAHFGKEDNFWEHGSGPCGPCSEIYFDRGESYGCGKPDCKVGCDCDRFIEVWNIVFTQFDSDGKGNYTPLAHPNIDTGMGLERLACVMQGVDNLFEVDTIRHIRERISATANKAYGKNAQDDISIRVITDHIRSTVFLISDGVVPSNEGRGYVLRRILRRAARHGKLLGIEGEFLWDLVDTVVEESRSGYPELAAKADYIRKVVRTEEDRFAQTLDQGLSLLSELLAETKQAGKTVLPGSDSFKLYDTYGFPIDLTRELAAEQGITLDREGFDALMLEQRSRARAARKKAGGWDEAGESREEGLVPTVFEGYDASSCEAKVVRIMTESGEVEQLTEGEATLVLDKSVCYAESGGQVGDTGKVASADGLLCEVSDTHKTPSGVFLHEITVRCGTLRTGDTVTVSYDAQRRQAIRRNHSCVHLLQAALRQVIGAHVEQAGSYVDAERLRFDFKHFTALTAEELSAVSRLVNEKILENLPVKTEITDMASAQKQGAMALFGEKYGKTVRLVKMGDFSAELCGGTHLSFTGEAGLFAILSENGISAGVRRIEAVTGMNFIAQYEEEKALCAEAAAAMKAQSPRAIVERATGLMAELSAQKKECEALRAKLSAASLSELEAKIEAKDGCEYLFYEVENAPADSLRQMTDLLRDKHPALFCVLASVLDGKVLFCASCGKEALAHGAHAGEMLKAISPLCGGGGGGRPDSAQSGGKNPLGLAAAREEFRKKCGL